MDKGMSTKIYPLHGGGDGDETKVYTHRIWIQMGMNFFMKIKMSM